jgi:hypothetical protein
VSAHEVTTTWSEFQTSVEKIDLPSGMKSPIFFVSDVFNALDKSIESENNFLLDSMEVYIGNIRVSGNVASFDVISDNTVRGAAGNSVLLAEMMLAQGIIHDSPSAHFIRQDVR